MQGFDRSFQFRAAIVQESALIANLVNSGYRGESSKKGWTTEADLLGGQRTDADDVARMINDADAQVVLCVDISGEGETVRGCAYLKFSQVSRRAYVGMVTVRPEGQAQGVGRALLAECERRSRESGHHSLKMSVIDRRLELIAYYERRGYQKTGAWEPFPEDPKFGLAKVSGLKLLELVKTL